MSNFVAELDKLYRQGLQILSDVEYDALVRIYGEGDDLVSDGGEIPHETRLYSLDKKYQGDELPADLSKYVRTIKLDGAAISLLYENGKLVRALTRGDGFKGNDVTMKMLLVPSIPKELRDFSEYVQIDGEFVTSKQVENDRNYAAGTLNTKDLGEFCQKVTDGGLIFVPTNIQEKVSGVWQPYGKTYSQALFALKFAGFISVLDSEVLRNCPSDGLVYRLDNNVDYTSSGFTSKFPKGAFALKQKDEEYETTLLDVVWQVGRTGKVTPVAILEPVQIEDAVIKQATLNNIEYIEALGLELGCRVKIVRAGKIIPKVVARAD